MSDQSKQPAFISYARADGLGFASRLASDLLAQGRTVWLDRDRVEGGDLWDVSIERGIRAARVVLVVMSPQAMRPESICRDEVVFALGEGKTIVPLRVSSDPDAKPTLLLARRNWIEFAENYENGLQDLLRYLSGDPSRMREPAVPTVSGVTPLDFGIEIAKLSKGFVGRQWFVKEIDRWLETDERRALVLVGEPGIGKSAIAAWLCRTREEKDVVGVHFCHQQNARTTDPHEFVASVVAQLDARLLGFAALVRSRRPDIRRPSAMDAFRELVVEPANLLIPPSVPLMIVVDSLDEAALQQGETIVDLLVRHVPDLPSWLRVLMTTRPEEGILSRIRTMNVRELIAGSKENREDVRWYIRQRLEQPKMIGASGNDVGLVGEQIEAVAEGNFLHVRLILDGLEERSLSPHDLRKMTPGLQAFYGEAFRRQFPDVDRYANEHGSLLRILAAAQGPLPFQILHQAVGQSPESTNRRLLQLRSYLRVEGKGESRLLTLFHKSLQEWLTDADLSGPYWCHLPLGHQQLADVLVAARTETEYSLRHLPAHLVGARRWNELADLLLDLPFVEAKVEAGMLFHLADELAEASVAMPQQTPRRRILRLLEEAVRTDIHFIAEHPSTLFQCLWNRCHWYGNDNNSIHYDALDNEQQRLPTTLETNPLEDLARVVNSWRTAKEREQSGSLWLRSLRPPPIALGGAVVGSLRGHSGPVRGVALSANGKWVASASEDGSVRIWERATGSLRAELRGHVGMVTCVAFSPDSQHLASGGLDRNILVWRIGRNRSLRTIEGHGAAITSIAFSPNGRQLVTGSYDHTAKLWDADSGTEIGTLSGHSDCVSSVAFSPDGRRLATGAWDKTVAIWDARSFEKLSVFAEHKDHVNAVAFSPDGRRLASGGSWEKEIWLRDCDEPRRQVRMIGHADQIAGIAFSPQGDVLMSASWDRTIRFWDVWSGVCMKCFRGHYDEVNALAVTSDGRNVVSASRDATILLWDISKTSQLTALKDHSGWVLGVAVSPNGELVATCAADHTVRIWEFRSGTQLGNFRIETSWLLNCIAFSPDGLTIAVGPSRAPIELWDIRDYVRLATLGEESDRTYALSFSPAGDVLASGDLFGVRIWSLKDGTSIRREASAEACVLSLCFSPDCKQLACGLADGITIVLSTSDWRIAATLGQKGAPIIAVAFSHDGTSIVTSAEHDSMRIYNCASWESVGSVAGCGDPNNLRGSPYAKPWVATRQIQEVVVERPGSPGTRCWLPTPLTSLRVHPSGRLWVGTCVNHVSMFTLEGAESGTAQT